MDLNCIDTSRIKDFSYMFQEMKGLQNLDISEWDVSKVKNSALTYKKAAKRAAFLISVIRFDNLLFFQQK